MRMGREPKGDKHGKARLRKATLAGVWMLMAGTSLPATTAHATDIGYVESRDGQGRRLLSESQIAHFKAVLRLNRDQERYWPAVAAALRGLQRASGRDVGFVFGLADRATELAAEALCVRRLVSAALPLYERLDDNQRQVALRIVRSLGLESFVTAL
jgi:hypothetical protein